MAHLSNWHSFDAADRRTYPRTNSPMQVKYAGGGLALGYTLDFFPVLNTMLESQITGWRYIKAYSSG
jgi:hypothetical protein